MTQAQQHTNRRFTLRALYQLHRHTAALVAVMLCLSLFCTQNAVADFAADPLILDAESSIVLNGIVMNDNSGISVSGVGDMNGDNVSDFVVGAWQADPFGVSNGGEAYLFFGRNATTQWQPNPFDIDTLDGTNGVTLNGVAHSGKVGWRVAGVQDVNEDGCNDMLIGAEDGSVAFLVFGMNGTWPAVVNLTQGEFNGVTIVGQFNDRTGYSVGSAGDVNDDGLPDIAIGARSAGAAELLSAGRMDVLFGRSKDSPWPSVVNVTTYVTTSTGFTVRGANAQVQCGQAVAGVGDVNGDGVDDVAVSCPLSDPGPANAGLVAVVFGSPTDLLLQFTPNDLDGNNGFVVEGRRTSDQIGKSLSAVGDVNGDGQDDFVIGAFSAEGNGQSESGEMYALFGRSSSDSWPARVNLSSSDGSRGFTLAGETQFDYLGYSVSAAGDVNADGFHDLLVGATGAGGDGEGLAFLLYGRAEWPANLNSSDLESGTSATFQGSAAGDNCGASVGLVGDVNGDGRADLAIGCDMADDGAMSAGRTSIVFGPLVTQAPTTTPPTMAPTTAAPVTVSPTGATAAPTPSASATPSPTPSTCVTQGAFVPTGATCVNGVLVTGSNTTSPSGTAVTVTTSVTVTGGASFEQPVGSTLVFVAKGSGSTRQSTSIAVQGGGCAAIEGDAVVNFEADPSNGGVEDNTGALVLVSADCVMGKFGAVSATTSFEGDDCVAVGDGEQVANGNSISVSFDVTNTCDKKSSWLSTWVLVGIIAGGAVVTALIVIVLVKLGIRARNRRAHGDVKMSRRQGW